MPAYSASQLPEVINNDTENIQSVALITHNGQRLSPKEDRFISLYLKLADAGQAAEQAGYTLRVSVKNKELGYRKRGQELLAKDYIQDEIRYRSQEFKNAAIADTNEVLIYLTNVMRGNIKDQFGLDAPLAERTSAAKELNRRLRELEVATNTESGKEIHLILERR
jgi:phage terminase small subunit